jgi:starch synthase
LGSGLDGALRRRSEDLAGILNGADYAVWHPSRDTLIAKPYSADDVDAGKTINKRSLARAAGFPEDRWDRPLIGVVSRLASQKGFDLVAKILPELDSLDVNVVVLGTGEKRLETMFREWATEHSDRFCAYLMFDNGLAHQIEAGSDIFLMPSRYEPCGLNQMYSLAYGTVPLVRATGGLADSVSDADEFPDTGTGFVFRDYTADALLGTIRRAIAAHADVERWSRIRERGMACDFSWDRSAVHYEELYESALRVDAATAFHHH